MSVPIKYTTSSEYFKFNNFVYVDSSGITSKFAPSPC